MNIAFSVSSRCDRALKPLSREDTDK